MFIQIRIEGRTPLLMRSFSDEAAEEATSGERGSGNKDRGTPQEQAEAGLYISEHDGKIVIPAPNLYRCIVDAGKFHKSGANKVTTLKSSLIPACLVLDQVEYVLTHKQPWKVDTRPVCIPKTGGRILRHRACFDDWSLRFVATLDTNIISEKLFRLIVDDGGRKIGLGDFRPDCKGPFGKFDVTQWTKKRRI